MLLAESLAVWVGGGRGEGGLWQRRSGTLANRRNQPCARGEVDLLQSEDIGKVREGGSEHSTDHCRSSKEHQIF